MPAEIVRPEHQAILSALGFALQQIDEILGQGVSIDQLRGMLRYRQCVDPAFDAADLAARIDQLEQFEKFPLDSHAA